MANNCLVFEYKERANNSNLEYLNAVKYVFHPVADGNKDTLLLWGVYDVKIGGVGVTVKILSNNAHIHEDTGGAGTNHGSEYTFVGTTGRNIYIKADSTSDIVFLLIGLDKIQELEVFVNASAANLGADQVSLETNVLKKLPYMSALKFCQQIHSEDIIFDLDVMKDYETNEVLQRFSKRTHAVGYDSTKWIGNFKYLGVCKNIKLIDLSYASLSGSIEEFVEVLKANGAVSDSQNPIQLKLGYSGVKERIASTESITWTTQKNLTWDDNDFYLT